MAIDARIPLGAQAPQISPLANYLRILQVEEARAAAQERAQDRAVAREDRDFARQERLAAVRDRDRIREALGGPGGLTEEKVNQVFGIDPETGLKLRQHLTAMTREQRLAAQEKAEDAARILIGVRDQAGYDNALRTLAAAGHDTAGFSKQFDPGIVDGYVKRGLTLSQLISLSSKQEEKPVLVDTVVNGKAGKKAVVPKAGDFYEAPPKGADGSEPLVEVDEGGVPIYRPRPDAVGKKAYHPPRAAAGDKPAVSAAQRAIAERWKQGELAKVEEAFRLGDIEPADRDAQKLQIENGYRAQIGEEPVAALGPEWDWAGRRGAAPAASNPAVPKVKVGQTVTLRNGTQVRVTKINKDGTYEGSPVK